jgi:hypothetical protein
MPAINTQYITNLTAQINSINDCATLQLMVTQVEAEMTAQLAAAERQIAALLPLTTIPTNLSQCISFITSQVAFYEAQYAQAIAAEAALVAAYAGLISAITSKISTLGCSITPPTP